MNVYIYTSTCVYNIILFNRMLLKNLSYNRCLIYYHRGVFIIWIENKKSIHYPMEYITLVVDESRLMPPSCSRHNGQFVALDNIIVELHIKW